MPHLGKFTDDCCLIRQTTPLIHNITNYVAMEISANALLAIGASPLMSSEPDEMEEIVSLASAVVINIGCLEQRQIEAMKTAASTAARLGKPWVLDPAGAGASRLRTATALELIERYHPTVVRGNASEIMVLAGGSAQPHGLDSTDKSIMAVEHARKIAKQFGTVVSTSGPVDYITDGEDVVSIRNGSPLMPSVTAMGCAASAITAAFLAVDNDALSAASCAMALMGAAGETAASGCEGPGSLKVKFIDTLYGLKPEEAEKMIRQ
ncbi:MAG: hydroxyethylthiazole kinase [Bacteroidia bacterium]|nr:hydroxyethylthiazole kinase [Bacteroidia bacterium]